MGPISLKMEEGRKKGGQRADDIRTWPDVAGFKDGGRGHKPKNVDGLQKLEESSKLIFL